MEDQTRATLNALAGECRVYTPIAATVNQLLTDAAEKDEDTGCDSCLHWHNGRCDVYRRDRLC